MRPKPLKLRNSLSFSSGVRYWLFSLHILRTQEETLVSGRPSGAAAGIGVPQLRRVAVRCDPRILRARARAEAGRVGASPRRGDARVRGEPARSHLSSASAVISAIPPAIAWARAAPGASWSRPGTRLPEDAAAGTVDPYWH